MREGWWWGEWGVSGIFYSFRRREGMDVGGEGGRDGDARVSRETFEVRYQIAHGMARNFSLSLYIDYIYLRVSIETEREAQNKGKRRRKYKKR